MWEKLNTNQRRYAIAMLESSTKKEAAELVGIEPNTAYKWGDEINKVVDFMRANIEASAMGIILNAASKAAAVKSGGLDSEDERVRQGVATEILDRMLGKPTQRSELTGADGGPVEFSITEWQKKYQERIAETAETATLFDDDNLDT
jgi:hypothetical protein